MFKKITIVVLALSLSISLLSACTSSQTTPAAPNTSPTVSPTSSEKVPVSIEVPAKWEKKVKPNTLLDYEKATSLISVMTIPVATGVSNAEGQMNYDLKAMKEGFSDSKFFEPEKLTIDGKDAWQFSMKISVASFTQIQNYTYIMDGAVMYKITGVAFPDSEAELKEIQSMVASFKII